MLTLALTGFSLVPPWLNRVLIDDVLLPVSAAYLEVHAAEEAVVALAAGPAVTAEVGREAQQAIVSANENAHGLAAAAGPPPRRRGTCFVRDRAAAF